MEIVDILTVCSISLVNISSLLYFIYVNSLVEIIQQCSRLIFIAWNYPFAHIILYTSRNVPGVELIACSLQCSSLCSSPVRACMSVVLSGRCIMFSGITLVECHALLVHVCCRARALCETSLPHFHGLHRTVSPELRHCCATCSTALFTCDTSPCVQNCRYVCFYRLLCLILQQQIQDSGSSLALFVGPLHVQPVL